ncbi:uncharacterized protein [Montipora foliosa]|uniref:uncharacterized protein isoform X2 n=1 Tax=Montipora foliosa TaxID=591990 RepID=UPI0035F18424
MHVHTCTCFCASDGSSITWYEPPPIQNLLDTLSDPVGHLANSTQLLEGSINASLSWNFSLSSDLSFSSLTVSLGGTVIAGVALSGPGVQAGFKDKFDIRWIPFQRVTLIIFNVTTEVNGTFSCTVAAAKGFGTVNFGSNIQVHVVDPPSNIVTSRNITITAPDELTLNCSADGKPKPTRTWTRLSDNTVVTMPLNITGKQDAGGYRCTVDNGVGSPLTKDVFIAVLVRPKIDYLSSDWDVCENSTVILSCNATGEPTPNITWKRVADDEILPAVDGVYVIDSIKRNSSGRYSCKADNGVGIDSKTVNVTVRFAASIDGIINSSNTVNEGRFFNMTCQASDNPLPTNYTWISKDGLLFNGSVLSFINISRAEAGQYRCEVENQCGMDGRNTYVNVYYPPNITYISLNQTVVDEGDVVLLNCTADGNPEPNITWNRLAGNGAVGHVGPAETYLKIAGKQDEGGYTCIADNGIGNAAFSGVLNITVESYRPINTVFSTNLTNNTVNLNESFILICNADANPAATFRLYREQEILQEHSNGTYLTFVSTRTKQVTYTCIPFNDFGDGLSKTINVTVYYNPATVHLVTNTTENENCCDFLVISFTCKASEANPPVENYQLLKNHEIVDTSSKGTWITTISSKGNHIYSCKALHPLGNVASADVTVTFNVPVQIFVHVQSGSETLLEGGNVSLYCNASGYPEPTVSWTKLNADDLIVSSQLLNFSIISKEATGEYICNANNTCGKKQSAVRTIDVQYKPENVHLSTSSHKICAGKMVILRCFAGDSNPAVETFTLYKKGLRLANVTRANVGVFNQVLYIQGQHIYSCVASNAIGIASSSNTMVEVEVPASVTMENHTIVVREGDNVTLHCMSSGFPQPNVSWVNNSNYLMEAGSILNLTNIRRHNREYNCSASNACGNDSRQVYIDVQYAAEDTGGGGNDSVPEGNTKLFSCPVDGNPEPNITWYKGNYVIGPEISHAKQLEARETGCYTCSGSNSLGTPVIITQCLTVVPEEPTSASPTSTGQPPKQFYAALTIMEDFVSEYRDLNNQVSKQLVDSFVSEMDKIYQNDDNYLRTEVTGLRSGSVIVSFILYFKNAVTLCQGISKLEAAISNGTFGTHQVGNLTLLSPGTSTSVKSTTPRTSQPTEFQCACDNTLLVIIGVLVAIIIVLILVIAWQHRKLGIAGKKRPYKVTEDKDRRMYDNEVAMDELNPTNDPPSSSNQQRRIPIEPAYMPLQGTSHYEVGPSSPNNSPQNPEYAPLDIRTRSWEVTREDVKVEKIIGKGAFGQVAKGTAKNLPFHSGTKTVAVKMLKANAPASDKRDLKSELELMKTLKPHPHVIKLLGCVTETDPLLVLIEYVPYGDLLGYLRKSRGLNDTYYKDPDIKPQTNLTSQQLMKFAWQISDGMSYLSLRKIIHRDLAARNVLVGETETCKVTDFGMARDVQQENIYERKTRGRLPVKWTAYESLLYGKYTTKSDVWSYGVLLYEIFTVGGSPYPRMDGKKIASLLQQGYRMPKPQHVDNDLYQIMMNCWQNEPEARPSFADLTQELKGMENQHKRLLNMHIYDNTLYAKLEDLNA